MLDIVLRLHFPWIFEFLATGEGAGLGERWRKKILSLFCIVFVFCVFSSLEFVLGCVYQRFIEIEIGLYFESETVSCDFERDADRVGVVTLEINPWP